MTFVVLRSVVAFSCVLGSAAFAYTQEDVNEQQVVSQFPEQAPPHQVLLHPHRERRDKYLWGTFGPPGLLDSALGASFGQWLKTPAVWGQTPTGFAKRFA